MLGWASSPAAPESTACFGFLLFGCFFKQLVLRQTQSFTRNILRVRGCSVEQLYYCALKAKVSLYGLLLRHWILVFCDCFHCSTCNYFAPFLQYSRRWRSNILFKYFFFFSWPLPPEVVIPLLPIPTFVFFSDDQ